MDMDMDMDMNMVHVQKGQRIEKTCVVIIQKLSCNESINTQNWIGTQMYDSKEARKNSEVGTWKTAEFLHTSYLGIPMPVPTEVPT